MNSEEIRAEIQRLKRLALDLRLRETLWLLYRSHLKFYPSHFAKDPELIPPEIRESIVVSDSTVEFRFEGNAYKLRYVEGEKKYSKSWDNNHITTTPGTITFGVDGYRVFEFRAEKTIESTPDFPTMDERMGDVTAFIEGPWVSVVPELLRKLEAHSKGVYEKRNAPMRQKQLDDEMTRFGLA